MPRNELGKGRMDVKEGMGSIEACVLYRYRGVN